MRLISRNSELTLSLLLCSGENSGDFVHAEAHFDTSAHYQIVQQLFYYQEKCCGERASGSSHNWLGRRRPPVQIRAPRPLSFIENENESAGNE